MSQVNQEDTIFIDSFDKKKKPTRKTKRKQPCHILEEIKVCLPLLSWEFSVHFRPTSLAAEPAERRCRAAGASATHPELLLMTETAPEEQHQQSQLCHWIYRDQDSMVTNNQHHFALTLKTSEHDMKKSKSKCLFALAFFCALSHISYVIQNKISILFRIKKPPLFYLEFLFLTGIA